MPDNETLTINEAAAQFEHAYVRSADIFTDAQKFKAGAEWQKKQSLITLEDINLFFANNKQSMTGVFAGEYIDKEDFLKFASQFIKTT